MLYVAATPDGPVKLGIARNVERRLAALQNGNPEDLRIVWAATTRCGAPLVGRRRSCSHRYRLDGDSRFGLAVVPDLRTRVRELGGVYSRGDRSSPIVKSRSALGAGLRRGTRRLKCANSLFSR